MVVCFICQQDMNDVVSCTPEPMLLVAGVFEPVRYGQERDAEPLNGLRPCGDCNCPPGGVHHHGCDMEECPNCRGQAFACGCQEGDDPDVWDDEPVD